MQIPRKDVLEGKAFHSLTQEDVQSAEQMYVSLRKEVPVLEELNKNVEAFDVKCLLDILEGHKIFGHDFKKDIAKLYSLLGKAYKAIDNYEKAEKSRHDSKLSEEKITKDQVKFFTEIMDLISDINNIESKLYTDLRAAHEAFKDLGVRVKALASAEDQILLYIRDFERKLKPSGRTLLHAEWGPITDAATNIQGAMKNLIPLFNKFSNAYSDWMVEVEELIKEDVEPVVSFMDVDVKKMRSGAPVPDHEKQFERVLARINLIEKTLEEIVREAKTMEHREVMLVKNVKADHLSNAIKVLLKHPKLPELVERKRKIWAKFGRK